jgi:hypothetical protein
MARSTIRGRTGSTRTGIVSPIGRVIGHVPTASEQRFGAIRRAALITIRLMWWYRRELLVATVPVALGYAAGMVLPSTAAWALTIPAVAALAVFQWRTHGVSKWLDAGAVRRRFNRACRQVWLYDINDRTPWVRRVAATPVGYRLSITTPPGVRRTLLQRHADDVAAALKAQHLRIVPDAQRADRASVTIVVRDPLTHPMPRSPLHEVTEASIWSPAPVGISEDRLQVALQLVGQSVLIGGAAQSGASATLAHIVAAAALDPRVVLWLLDPGGITLRVWRDRAHGHGVTIDETIDLLTDLIQVIDARWHQGRVALDPPEEAVHVVVRDDSGRSQSSVTEAAHRRLLRAYDDVVARGPMVRVIPLLAVHPASVLMPRAAAEQFTCRWALRCETHAQSDAILGHHWASRGISATDVDPTAHGVGWLVSETRPPVRLRSYHLTRPDIAALAARAAALKREYCEDRGHALCAAC